MYQNDRKYFHISFATFLGYTSFIGGSNDVGTIFTNVYLQRTGELLRISMWKGALGGGTGDTRGRIDPIGSASAGDWQTGDA